MNPSQQDEQNGGGTGMSARKGNASLEDDPVWYKDAIIYHLHVKTFFDSNNDGVGDFQGLTTKLDYIQDLGANTIWLLPFYPSPMRDDGYDIADYHNIHSAYGSRRDFRNFVREAHRRGIRIITELVINHTSDQHPWFQAARRAPPNSPKRDFYLWSETDQRFPETRIIFTDTESSNWAWDPLAQAYYWHRFFSHQPDLNHNNPQVVRAVTRVMRFWLDMGVDGVRLDAIPYLCVREGSHNENLAETHAVVKQMRAVVDAHYRNRLFLAEANQWPEDVRDYFGAGDECHMAYHFPLMPRMYMAIAQEDRHPIVEIMDQTPSIPETCQWAIFLRNHDELTLEMVTDEERDYMYQAYASDPRMRVNVGIRRRLAPLMDNDNDKIKLMNSLLMSMPGSPIIYYGDEIGMGDNIFLGDRNAVRTPMQWSPDRNAGFSKADPQRLYLPPVMDPMYGYEAVNVEAQSRAPSSLLNWTKRLIAVRKAYQAFGRGRLEFIKPGNRKIIAYLRTYQDSVILCVANLARSAQPVELDLARFKGRVPVELMGRTAFPPIGELPYLLTLTGHGFYWFHLAAAGEAPSWHQASPPPNELPVLVMFEGWKSFFPAEVAASHQSIAERMRERFLTEALPAFLPVRRWFAAKGQRLERVGLVAHLPWSEGGRDYLLSWIQVDLAGQAAQTYFLPLATAWGGPLDEHLRELSPYALARVRHQSRVGILHDALRDGHFCQTVVRAMGRNQSHRANGMTLRFTSTAVYPELLAKLAPDAAIERPTSEGSNTAIILGTELFLKAYRRLESGVNPELEMGRFLTERSPFANVVPLLGALEHENHDGTVTTLALLQKYVPAQGDAWSYWVDYLQRFLEDALLRPSAEVELELEALHAANLTLLHTLGRRTGELHRALARHTGDPAFDPEPVHPSDLGDWRTTVRAQARATLQRLEHEVERLPEGVRTAAEQLIAARQRLLECIERSTPAAFTGLKTRLHGDYHLGQVLVVENDFIIIDFEGEPARPLAERRQKHSPLKDVAGMLRSFSYALHSALQHVTAERPADRERLVPFARDWERRATTAFLAGYAEGSQEAGIHPESIAAAWPLIALFTIEKALYELRYELDNRPAWVGIPVAGLRALLDQPEADFGG
ncbi:Alpha amylase, catalytic region [Nitrococcus mobilis Nb-231]|uniref:Maltokinase n=2 Tax=Nitrococcus mobilis TaxID=35797 RepID=A4BM95_9GAMM|nr:Alpha amylase, catalytic region [Nitrococcus mobilis Nb-231]